MTHRIQKAAGVVLLVLGVTTLALSGSHNEAAMSTQAVAESHC